VRDQFQLTQIQHRYLSLAYNPPREDP
jgi:hypothetical protein